MHATLLRGVICMLFKRATNLDLGLQAVVVIYLRIYLRPSVRCCLPRSVQCVYVYVLVIFVFREYQYQGTGSVSFHALRLLHCVSVCDCSVYGHVYAYAHVYGTCACVQAHMCVWICNRGLTCLLLPFGFDSFLLSESRRWLLFAPVPWSILPSDDIYCSVPVPNTVVTHGDCEIYDFKYYNPTWTYSIEKHVGRKIYVPAME